MLGGPIQTVGFQDTQRDVINVVIKWQKEKKSDETILAGIAAKLTNNIDAVKEMTDLSYFTPKNCAGIDFPSKEEKGVCEFIQKNQKALKEKIDKKVKEMKPKGK